jgi:2Fe-2S ferredoxin
MIHLTVINRQGEERAIEAAADLSLMEALREAGYDELAAMCGGSCACATCHVYIQPAFGALPPKAEAEQELLETSLHLREDSRLSCQVPIGEALDGARVTLAPED